jgi:hypothetical protein
MNDRELTEKTLRDAADLSMEFRARIAALESESAQYREAAEKAEAEVERLRGAIIVIEEASANCSCENELECAAYRFSHVVARPNCVKNHPEWAEQLEAARAALAAGEG